MLHLVTRMITGNLTYKHFAQKGSSALCQVFHLLPVFFCGRFLLRMHYANSSVFSQVFIVAGFYFFCIMPSLLPSPDFYRNEFLLLLHDAESSAFSRYLSKWVFYLLCTIPSPLSSPGIYRSGFLLLHYVKSSALSRYLSKLILRFLYCVKSSVFSGYSLLRVFCLFCTMPSPLPSPGIYRKGFSLISMSLFLFLCLFFCGDRTKQQSDHIPLT